VAGERGRNKGRAGGGPRTGHRLEHHPRLGVHGGPAPRSDRQVPILKDCPRTTVCLLASWKNDDRDLQAPQHRLDPLVQLLCCSHLCVNPFWQRQIPKTYS